MAWPAGVSWAEMREISAAGSSCGFSGGATVGTPPRPWSSRFYTRAAQQPINGRDGPLVGNAVPVGVGAVWRRMVVFGLAAGGAWTVMALRSGRWLPLLVAAVLTAAALWWRRVPPGATVLARSSWGTPVVLTESDRLLHLHVVGPTGAGKSTAALLPLLASDLAAGAGVVVLDPKGDVAASVRDMARASGRTCHFVCPGDPESAGLNPLAGDTVRAAEATALALDRLFSSTADSGFYRTLGQVLVRHGVRAVKAAYGDDATVATLARFFAEPGFRQQVLAGPVPADVRAFFTTQFAAWSERSRTEYTIGLNNQLSALLGNELVAATLDGPAVDLALVLARGDVLAVALPVGRLGATAAALGTFLLYQLQAAVHDRPAGGPSVYLYLDEFHLFASEGFAEFLAMARGYRVGLVLAHQDLGQLPANLTAAVLANARNRLVFGGVSVADAALFAAEAGMGRDRRPRWSADAIRRLPRGAVLVLATHQGALLPPRRAWVRPWRPPSAGHKAALTWFSQAAGR